MKHPFLHLVADYGPGDLAFSKMISALTAHLPPEARWHVTPVRPPQDGQSVPRGFAQLLIADQCNKTPRWK